MMVTVDSDNENSIESNDVVMLRLLLIQIIKQLFEQRIWNIVVFIDYDNKHVKVNSEIVLLSKP